MRTVLNGMKKDDWMYEIQLSKRKKKYLKILLFFIIIHISRGKFILFEILIFCPKIQFWFPEKNCRIVLGENSWKCCGFGLFSCWQLWFHEKNCQKYFGWKSRENAAVLDLFVVDNFDFTRKIVKFCQNWIFGQKFDFSNGVSVSDNLSSWKRKIEKKSL